MNSMTEHGQARVAELKFKVQEANRTRMANFKFPQPAYDRLYAWIIGMVILAIELEQKEKEEGWEQLQRYVDMRLANSNKHRDDMKNYIDTASEFAYFSQKEKWSSLIGKLEMMLDVITQFMQETPERVRYFFPKFNVKENWPKFKEEDCFGDFYRHNGLINSGKLEDTIEYEVDKQQPYLLQSLRVLMQELHAKNIYKTAVEELRLVTVPSFKPKWTPKMGRNGYFIRNDIGPDRGQLSVCAICLQPANVPFHHCNFCKESPSFHHGRCCPMVTFKTQEVDKREEDVWGSISARSAKSTTINEKNSSSSWELINPY
jgi:hypothetical protein